MKTHTKEQVEAVANSIVSHFIPKDSTERNLSFYFTIPPASNYQVNYQKNEKGEWDFISFKPDDRM